MNRNCFIFFLLLIVAMAAAAAVYSSVSTCCGQTREQKNRLILPATWTKLYIFDMHIKKLVGVWAHGKYQYGCSEAVL